MPRVDSEAIARWWGFSGVTGKEVENVLRCGSVVIGADMAPNHSALVAIFGEEIRGHKIYPQIDTKEWSVDDRYSRYHQELSSMTVGKSLIALEDYSFQKSTQYNSHETILIAENAALFKLAAVNLGCSVLKVAVPRVKSFVRRIQQFDKKLTIEFCQLITNGWVDEVSKNRLGKVKSETLGDVCDSLALALTGAFTFCLKRNPRILDQFPAPFVHMFTNKEQNGLVDILGEKVR